MDTESPAVFKDRMLKCLDCGGDFVFTAGEQLFFSDKQFKNDPKRCKPCKLRRSGVAVKPSAGPAAAGISRTETRTKCSECGVETTVPFRPTQGRPVLCRQCFQTKGKPNPLARAIAAFGDPTVSALTQAASGGSAAGLTQEAAVVAAASMSAAPAHSSVATAADLAAITDRAGAALREPVPLTPVNPVVELAALETTQA